MKTKLMQLADDYAGIPSDTYYLDQKYDSRAALEAEIDRVVAERDALRADAERYRWLTTTGGGIGMRLAEVEAAWDGCDGMEGFNAALERCRAKRLKGKS